MRLSCKRTTAARGAEAAEGVTPGPFRAGGET